MYIQGDDLKKAINIRLEEGLLGELDAYAKELERPRTYLIEKAISAYFDTLDELVSDKRIDDVKSGKSKLISLEDMIKQAGLNV